MAVAVVIAVVARTEVAVAGLVVATVDLAVAEDSFEQPDDPGFNKTIKLRLRRSLVRSVRY
jgi:hypothetical protein